jgi:hypothetical protein
MGRTCPQDVHLYNSTRQELSYDPYSQDAASRVIARLMRECDTAREYVFFLSRFVPLNQPNVYVLRAPANVQGHRRDR